MIVLYNPYESDLSTGAARRIDFLQTGLNQLGVKNRVVFKGDIENSISYKLFRRLPLGLRLLFFLQIFLFAIRGYKVVTEVIFAPVWMNNVFLTIHDLKAFEPKAQRGKGKKEIYRVFSKKARHIIAVSHYTKQQIVTLCGVDPEKVSVIENGISKERLEHIQKYEPSAHYDFVYVSSFAKHKMHKLLVESLPKGASLLAIGRDFGELNFVHETIKSRSGEIEVSIRTDVEDDGELFSLLKSAKVGVFPSIYEGFGIPLLEYKAAGLFVNASDILPFQELSTFVDSFHQQGNKESLEYSLIHSLKKYQTAKKVDKELERFNEVHLADKLTVCLGISVGKVK